MRNLGVKRNLLLLIMFFLSLVTFFAQSETVHALPSNEDVLQAAPNGIKLGDFFEYPSSYSGTETVNNSVQIHTAGNGNSYPVDIIQMTNGEKQVSSIWGTKVNPKDASKDYNYFDLTKEQTISGWLYVGPEFNVSGDGISLVLQNDANGINAIGRYDKPKFGLGVISPAINKAAFGESMGVWGATASPATATESSSLSNSAIQNSFALEFDAFRNSASRNDDGSINDHSTDDLFDGLDDANNTLETKGQHVAWGYPGESDTYGTMMYLIHYFWGMHHKNVIKNATIGGYDSDTGNTGKDGWHHFLFTYTPNPADPNHPYINYTYNDRLSDGTIKPYSQWDKRPRDQDSKIQIDLAKFNLSPGQTKIRWGFTSSTGSLGSEFGINALVIEKIPALADMETESSLYDETQKHNIKDLDKKNTGESATDYTVGDGDRLTFSYDLTYKSGLNGTGPITAHLQLPQHVLYENDADGHIGEVHYADNPDKVTYITADELFTSQNAKGQDVQSVNLELGALYDGNKNFTIKIYGTAQAPASDELTSTTVNPEHTSYKSDFYNDDVMSFGFIIDNEKLNITADKKSQSQTVTTKDDVNLTGIANYIRKTAFDGKELQAHITVTNENDPETQGKDDPKVDSVKDALTQDFSLKIAAGSLEPGNNKVEVYLTDSKKRASNTIIYDINVIDSQLIVTPGDDVIDVTDNQPVDLTGSYGYDDGAAFKSNEITKTYEITHEDGTVREITQTDKIIDGTIDIGLKPVAYDRKLDQSLEDYLKEPAADNVLAEGKNTVKITVQDGSYASAETVVVINVPKLSPTITQQATDITVIGANGDINFPMDFDYNGEYTLNSPDLTGVFQVDDGDDINLKINSPTEVQSAPFDMTFDIPGGQLGLTEDKEIYQVTVYFTDPYGRKTNSQTFNVKVLPKALELEFDDYEFQTVNPRTFTPGYISRSGDWDLSVTSYKSRWTLNAQSGNLDYQAQDNTLEPSNLSMSYIDENNLATSLKTNPEIARSDNEYDNSKVNVDDISDDWDSDEGILLRADSLPRAGQYQGWIFWDLTESL